MKLAHNANSCPLKIQHTLINSMLNNIEREASKEEPNKELLLDLARNIKQRLHVATTRTGITFKMHYTSHTEYHYTATITGQPDKTVTGNTPSFAAGSLVRRYPEDFGIGVITWEDGIGVITWEDQ